MGFIEIKQEMIDKKLFQEPNPFFGWAKSKFEMIKDEGETSAKGFAFHLLDYVTAASLEEVEDPDEVYRGIISHAKELGIEPWPNVIGLRLQASTCLAEYLERG